MGDRLPPLPVGEGRGEGELSAENLSRLLARFHQEHERAYGYSAPAEPAEFVNWRLTAVGKIGKVQLRELKDDGQRTADEGRLVAEKGRRQVYFAESGGYIDCPIIDRYKLLPGDTILGPGIIEEFDSTSVIHPGYKATVDEYGNMLVTKL